MICGDAVLVGPATAGGNTRHVPQLVKNTLLRPTRHALMLRITGSSKWHRHPEDFAGYFEAVEAGVHLAAIRPEVEVVRLQALE